MIRRMLLTALTLALLIGISGTLTACQRGDRIERRYEENTVTTETRIPGAAPQADDRGGQTTTVEEHRSEPRIIVE